jgi:RNA polymerase sigma-70 factor (ECF subfamily)
VGSRNGGLRALPGSGALAAPDAGLESLLGEVARGNQPAFEAVCRRVAATVFGVIRAVVRDPSQSEGVFQEVLLQV